MARRWAFAVAVLAGVPATAARADGPTACHAVTIDFTPASDPYEPQIVAWVEDGLGNFIATAFITQQTGRYGLGNRPGRYDFNSGPQWPYGRRINVFPVWAHRQPNTYPMVRFQLSDASSSGVPYHQCCDSDDLLSHDRDISSPEPHYCPPEPIGSSNVDAVTCASQAFTDKGVFDMTMSSLYPPRADLGSANVEPDSPSAAQYAAMNPFDAVTGATPAGGAPFEISWAMPGSYANGTYVLFLEVSKEFDQNATYSVTAYPPPQVPYGSYGAPYRGQPSIVFQVPLTIAGSAVTASGGLDYLGYGDITGATGTLFPPDDTITTDVPGSGPNRLQLLTDGSGNQYRVAVTSQPQVDSEVPNAPVALSASAAEASTATLTFTEASYDPTVQAPIVGYQIRVLAEAAMTDANFASALPVSASVTPGGPGHLQTVQLTGLLPQTAYSIGVRAVDSCGNPGTLAVTAVETPERSGNAVDACFVATAAYGTVMANEVEVLRRFRDLVLRRSVLGELFVESYYTFGPPVAGVVGQSELLRASARDALAPVVSRVR